MKITLTPEKLIELFNGSAKDEHVYNAADALSVYDQLKQIRTQIDAYLVNLNESLTTLESNLKAGNVLTGTLFNADESAAQSVALDTQGNKLLSYYALATTATKFYIDVSPDNTNWGNLYTSASAETSCKDTVWSAYRYVKIHQDAAGTSGTDTVTLILSSK